jgi:hypothetical protein
MTGCGLGSANCGLFNALIANIINPMLLLVTGAAFLVFIWGVVEFLIGISKGQSSDTGKQHMIWGVFGLFVIICSYAILEVIQQTVAALGAGRP